MTTTIKETLWELFALDKMEPEKAAEMVDRLGKMVFQATLIRTLPMLSPEDMDEYERIVEGDQAEDMLRFLNEKIPNFNTALEEEAEILRAELAGEFDKTE